MKKIIITFTALLMAFGIGCGGSGNTNSDKNINTLALAVAKGDVGKVIFGSGQTGSEASLLKLKASIGGPENAPNASSIIVTIEDESNNIVYAGTSLPLTDLNGSYVSAPLSLVPGSYNLTQFIVVDADGNALYASPVQGSALAYLVNDPLAINFTVIKDQVSNVVPEVLSVESYDPSDFGYATFSFYIVDVIHFMAAAMVYNEAGSDLELTTANIVISSGSVQLYSGDLLAATNSLTIRDNFANYDISVTKDGYPDYTMTLTNVELKSYTGTPLILRLTRGAQWAKTTTLSSGNSWFNGVSTASDGSVYAVGYIYGTGTCNFGNGVTATGSNANNNNALMVKYNSSGVAQWAQTVTVIEGNDSQFTSVAVASDGSVYAAGYTGHHYLTYDVVTTIWAPSDHNIILMKYNSSGVAEWAQTVTADNPSLFNSVAIASDGSVYAAGQLVGTGTCNFGNGVTATGAADATFLLVKYNSSGVAQWAETVTADGISSVNGVTVAPDGSVYATGIIGSGIYNFGNGVTLSGVSDCWMNFLLVKYDSSGVAQWAQTVTGGAYSKSNSVSVASDGSVYSTGHIGDGTYNFGNGVTATFSNGTAEHFVLVKYNSSGVAQWAQTATETEVSFSGGCGVAVLSDGSVYVAGYFAINDTPNFGNDVTLRINPDTMNVGLVKYNSSGVAQWAQGVTANYHSGFLSVAAAPDGSIYTAGVIFKSGIFNFGNGVTATGSWEDEENVLLVKYR